MSRAVSSQVFQALADPTRRAIVARLARRPRHVADLAGRFPMSRPAISKHLRILKSAGLVGYEEVGKKRFYRLNPRPLARLDSWLERYRNFWDRNLRSLKQHLESGGGFHGQLGRK